MGILDHPAVVLIGQFPWLAGVAIVTLVSLLIWWQVDRSRQEFDLINLFCENGKLSSRKLFESAAFVFTSIWYVGLIVEGKATTEATLAYGGMWVVARATGQYIMKPAAAPAQVKQGE